MEEHLIDVCDLDGEYFVNVRVWLDRGIDRYYLPRESAERLGEPDPDGNYALMRGTVTAEAEEIGLGGETIKVWGVSVGQLRTRPAEYGVKPS
ncbi:MAG TPA: hypothetical protein VHR66_25630 [Gemmataceae bacterium]|jgi:hypothetical protein|nr:hypothetical protein [Gemmataceae bacterium]